MNADLIERAARFHRSMPAATLSVLADNDPAAWALYVAWHEAHPDPASVRPARAKTMIRQFNHDRESAR